MSSIVHDHFGMTKREWNNSYNALQMLIIAEMSLRKLSLFSIQCIRYCWDKKIDWYGRDGFMLAQPTELEITFLQAVENFVDGKDDDYKYHPLWLITNNQGYWVYWIHNCLDCHRGGLWLEFLSHFGDNGLPIHKMWQVTLLRHMVPYPLGGSK